MAKEHAEERTAVDALEICARISGELRNLQQALGLQHVDATGGGSSAAAGELQVMQGHVDDLKAVLTALARRDEADGPGR